MKQKLVGLVTDDRGPDLQPGVVGVDVDQLNGIDDQGEIGWSGSDDRVWRIPLKDDPHPHSVCRSEERSDAGLYYRSLAR